MGRAASSFSQRSDRVTNGIYRGPPSPPRPKDPRTKHSLPLRPTKKSRLYMLQILRSGLIYCPSSESSPSLDTLQRHKAAFPKSCVLPGCIPGTQCADRINKSHTGPLESKENRLEPAAGSKVDIWWTSWGKNDLKNDIMKGHRLLEPVTPVLQKFNLWNMFAKISCH